MKLAMTIYENRISPVAESARQLLVVDVENRTVRYKETEHLHAAVSVFNYARRLAELEVEILICGAISEFFSCLVEGYGIQVIPFVRGEATRVLNAYLEDSLPSPEFFMTG